jgi:hypothetical protein
LSAAISVIKFPQKFPNFNDISDTRTQLSGVTLKENS